jgi:hypothetical protein
MWNGGLTWSDPYYSFPVGKVLAAGMDSSCQGMLMHANEIILVRLGRHAFKLSIFLLSLSE